MATSGKKHWPPMGRTQWPLTPNRAAVEWWVNLTWSDEPATLAGTCLLEFAEDGRCRELREYWHLFPKKLEPSDNWGR